jgi:hypothetical protein
MIGKEFSLTAIFDYAVVIYFLSLKNKVICFGYCCLKVLEPSSAIHFISKFSK